MRTATLQLVGAVGAVWVSCSSPSFGQPVLSEILYDPAGVNAGRQLVEVQNPGAAAVALAGHWLYLDTGQWQFPADATIPPGGTIVVHVGAPGRHTATDLYTGISGIRNLRAQDAVGLFRSNLFADPTQIVDFVQWGSPGQGGEEVAAAAGIWTAFTAVNTIGLREGSSIAYDGSGDSAGDWCVDGTPTLGAPNDSCSPSFSKSPVILSEVGRVRSGPNTYHPAIELRNVGIVLEDLAGKSIVLDGLEQYQFPSGSPDTIVGPGESMVLHIGVDGPNGPLEFYSGAGTLRDFLAADSVSFHSRSPLSSSSNIIDFVQWGAAGGAFEPIAAQAGIWAAGEFVDTSDLLAHGSLASLPSGQGAARWLVDNTPTLGAGNDGPPAPVVVINEILVDPPGGEPGNVAVELKNLLDGEEVVSAGLTLCTESDVEPGALACFTIPAGTVIPARGFLIVRLNRSGASGSGFVNSGPFPELSPAGGVLLLSWTPRSTAADNLVDYVRWGADPGRFEDLADSRGLWPGDLAIGTSYVRDGSSLAYYGEGDGSDTFRVDTTPSIGVDNDEEPKSELFRRGDCNDDAEIDISDAIKLFQFLFLGSRRPLCLDACDANDDASNDISDPVYILNFLFLAGPDLPAPGGGAACGADPSADLLTCNSFLSCAP